VWIEITKTPLGNIVSIRHFPFGKCGLKYSAILVMAWSNWSLPVWEVWIEILLKSLFLPDKNVTSRLGSVD